jgi:hypothetical protein
MDKIGEIRSLIASQSVSELALLAKGCSTAELFYMLQSELAWVRRVALRHAAKALLQKEVDTYKEEVLQKAREAGMACVILSNCEDNYADGYSPVMGCRFLTLASLNELIAEAVLRQGGEWIEYGIHEGRVKMPEDGANYNCVKWGSSWSMFRWNNVINKMDYDVSDLAEKWWVEGEPLHLADLTPEGNEYEVYLFDEEGQTHKIFGTTEML